MKNPYDKLAKFYDSIIGRYSNETVEKKLVAKYAGRVNSLLELGCGTGLVLEQFKSVKRLAGVDISPEMIKVAKSKRGYADYKVADITKFNSSEKFDCVLCVYDTMNHLQKFEDWKKVFKVAYECMTANGVFIFDINTISKLERLSEEPPTAFEYPHGYFIFDVSKVSRNKFDWDLKIFESIGKDNYKLTSQKIIESAFPVAKVISGLSKFFDILDLRDENIKFEATQDSERIYFICKRKL